MMIWTLLVITAFSHSFCLSSADAGCKNIGGSCLDWRHHNCIAGYQKGLCSGDRNRRCCKPCDGACTGKEATYGDSKCKNKGGMCMDNSNYCTESYLSGHCGGPAGRQCCIRNSAASSADSGCTSIGGNCLDWRHHKCIAGYQAGLCSGDKNRRCCKPCDDACTTKEASYGDSKCKSKGGTCFDNSNYCTGNYLSGHCGGPAGRQCCTKNSAVSSADSGCTNIGGNCMDWRHHKCIAGYEEGLCSGDKNRRCCKTCDDACTRKEASYSDSKCKSKGGTCMDNSNYCAGSYLSGHCGGPAGRQCCTKNAAGGGGRCDLDEYVSEYIGEPQDFHAIVIHKDFLGAMNTLNKYARDCRVTVHVTHAFRKAGQSLGGTVVAPASNSNHLVGHAIDFNLITPSGWCNSGCLAGKRNRHAKCFTDKVVKGVLRWGGVWKTPDPVHIDDGLNVYDISEWKKLYSELQKNCP